MSNVNNDKAKGKKESVSLLEMIRRRTGLLVGIVGLALLIFILETLLGLGGSIWGNDQLVAGYINGTKIDLIEYSNTVEARANNYRARNQGKELDASTRNQLIEGIWNEYIVKYAINPQFNKMGIRVGADELYDRVVMNPVQSVIQNLTDQNGQINQQFARPDGGLDLAKWRMAVQNVTGQSEEAVKQIEDQVHDTRMFEKFRSLVNGGLYLTKAEIENNFIGDDKLYKVSIVGKKMDLMSDSSVKVTDSDLEKYYSAHSYLYRQKVNARNIEYVTFNVLPTPEDVDAISKEAQRVAAEMKGKTFGEDSAIMIQENETGMPSVKNMTRKTMTVRDSGIYTAAPGTVFGPYNEGAYFKVYKLEAINNIADSARVRHILIGTVDPQKNEQKRTNAQAKREADSLVTLLKAGRVSFDSLVRNVSDDLGSRDKGGDYGWFDENEQFVEPFKNAGLMGTKGDLKVVETQFGYHIIEVLDVSKEHHNSYVVAEVSKKIMPSDQTRQDIYVKASKFAGENNNAEAFDKAVASQKLTKRVAEKITEGQRDVPGLDNAREIVRWAFEGNKGEVKLFKMEDRNVVVKLKDVLNKGTLPLEVVVDKVRAAVISEKKADIIEAEFKSKVANASKLEEYAEKMNIPVVNGNFNGRAVVAESFGKDEIMIGTALGTKIGGLSRLTRGESAVFVLRVDAVDDPREKEVLARRREMMENELKGRVDQDVFNALKELSNIDDRKSKLN